MRALRLNRVIFLEGEEIEGGGGHCHLSKKFGSKLFFTFDIFTKLYVTRTYGKSSI